MMVAALASADVWTWTDATFNHQWANAGNWDTTCQGLCCTGPCTSDDAIIPEDLAGWLIGLPSGAGGVDDVTISYDVEFGTFDPDPEDESFPDRADMTMHSLTINGPALMRVGRADITVTDD
jgi:hypothetical protein